MRASAWSAAALVCERVQHGQTIMRFYINVLTTYFPGLDPPYDIYYEQILAQVQLAEELGWECFMFNEHHFLGYGGLAANPAVLLAAAAARTSRIRLGPCIAILPLRHPLHTAEDYAMVDALSGGRLEFGSEPKILCWCSSQPAHQARLAKSLRTNAKPLPSR
jgi:hypothetical protein